MIRVSIIVVLLMIIIFLKIFILIRKEKTAQELNTIVLENVRPGRWGWQQQQEIQTTFIYELITRMWNEHPEYRFWLKKYIEALASDSCFKINEKQKIKIDLE